jgi:hypothetical protein
MLVGRFGTVTSDGRPRFPGGVPLLLAPALVALLLFPSALREDLERRQVQQWQARRSTRAARLQQPKAAKETPPPPRT